MVFHDDKQKHLSKELENLNIYVFRNRVSKQNLYVITKQGKVSKNKVIIT